ncbi:MAG: valine--tRNA ligase [Candidatus Nanohaloarchaea archaeon]
MKGDYSPRQVESKWQDRWVKNRTYAYTAVDDSSEVFSIDTPPPTVSGSLHMGHLYGQTLQDFQARFQRMYNGKVFQPFGYDDNGIASERLTEDELGIEHQDFTRREFQEKCREVCEEYEDQFTENMQGLGISHDWTNTYKTIEPRVQRISQLSFIDLYEKGREYRKKGPAIWCPECETAISQVETEDAERHSSFNDIEFELADGHGSLVISTTRPELLPACVAIFVHPEDEANSHLKGGSAKVPLFGHEVPIIEDERVDMEKGTGVVMCCTFGDQTDIEWYQAHDLPLRVAIDESGIMTGEAGKYEGMTTKEAREAIIEDLEEADHLLDSEDITHTVQVHERCDEDIEFLVTEQWYVELLDHKDKYLEAGEQMDWYPEKMFSRYEHWIEGLQWDWCISRQRDSGIPFPVWYCMECGEEVIADKKQLPVDPIEDEPPVDECPDCGAEGFEAEEDVFDTWATSSLTPLINAGWDWDEENGFTMDREELYPFDLRPEGHDIISFWLFHTVVKCYEHTGEVPFKGVMNHGHVLDENREKMSKSKGNVVTPAEVLEDFPVDAARYWAAGSKVGDDFPFKEGDLEAGEKLLRKIWNASKLVDRLAPQDRDIKQEELEPIDQWMLAKLDETVEYATEKFQDYEFAKARNRIRHVFWDTFCDDYLEITKQRLEGEDNRSAEHTLRTAHRKFLKLFAPFLSHITEEIYHQMYSSGFSPEMADGEDSPSTGSIHLSEWPETSGVEFEVARGNRAMQVISALRKYKSDHQMSMNENLATVKVYGDIEGFEREIQEVMHVEDLEILEEEPETERQIIRIKLDYERAGPKYGDKIDEIEEALENSEWNIDAGHLEVAGEHLKPEMFEVEDEHVHKGEGELVETEDAFVVVKQR